MAAKPYQLRYSYDPDQPVARAAVHSRHASLDDAARAFVSLSAPYKQIAVEEPDGLEYLNEDEEAQLQAICERFGYEIEEVEGR